jgi:hypothetical protein
MYANQSFSQQTPETTFSSMKELLIGEVGNSDSVYTQEVDSIDEIKLGSDTVRRDRSSRQCSLMYMTCINYCFNESITVPLPLHL